MWVKSVPSVLDLSFNITWHSSATACTVSLVSCTSLVKILERVSAAVFAVNHCTYIKHLNLSDVSSLNLYFSNSLFKFCYLRWFSVTGTYVWGFLLALLMTSHSPYFLLYNRTSGGKGLFGECEPSDGHTRRFYHSNTGRWHAHYRRNRNNRFDQWEIWPNLHMSCSLNSRGEAASLSAHAARLSTAIYDNSIFWPSTPSQLVMETKGLRSIINLKLHPWSVRQRKHWISLLVQIGQLLHDDLRKEFIYRYKFLHLSSYSVLRIRPLVIKSREVVTSQA